MDKQTFSWTGPERFDAFRFFGCHPDGSDTVFRVFAPGAKQVYVTGAFCGWEPCRFPMDEQSPGVFSCTVPNVRQYDAYKYVIETADGRRFFKSDPFAVHAETPPANASKVYFLDDYQWNDFKWMERRKTADRRPLNPVVGRGAVVKKGQIVRPKEMIEPDANR